MTNNSKTWVVAADDASAHIFAREQGGLKSVSDLLPDDSAGIEITNKTLGRSESSAGGHHNKYEPSMAQSRQRELAFAHQIAILLNDAAARQAFDKLVVVAAPQMLGQLRSELSDAARRNVTVEVAKEIANLPSPLLQDRLLAILHDPDIMAGRA